MEFSRALLVQRRKPSSPDLLGELEALAQTAGYSVVGAFDITTRPSSKFGISTGKAEEIRIWIEVNKPELVIFSPRLKSSQMYRLMKEWGVLVRDRAQIILEIFDKHARTMQAKLQIEQARLEYELPFIRHQLRMELGEEHTGARPVGEQVGAGEDLLSLRIMELRRRIATIRTKLEKISKIQQLKRKRRSHSGFLEVTLAGYTNAGKSTLHKALTDSEVEIADQLFTTLATKTAGLDMPGRHVVLSDSVGFISNLPASLLDAFNTTLMEIADADVLILVIDASDSIYEMQRKTDACFETFREIGVNGIPIVVALNKIDLLSEAEIGPRVDLVANLVNAVVPISALAKTNLDSLVDAIEEHLPRMHDYSIQIPYGDSGMSLLSWLHENSKIKQEKYQAGEIEVEASLSLRTAQKLIKMLPQGALKRLGE